MTRAIARLSTAPAENHARARAIATDAIVAPVMRETDLLSEAGRLIGALWRRRLLVAAVATLGAIGSVLLALSLSPVFTAYAQLVFDRPAVPLPGQERSGQLPGDIPILIQSEVQTLRSQELLGAVAARLELARSPEFARALARVPPDAGPAEIEARLLTALAEMITIGGVGESRVIEITVKTRDPALSAAIANTLVDTYLEREADHAAHELDSSIDLLGARIAAMESDVATRAARLQDYRRKANLFLTETAEALALQLADVEAQAAVARADLAVAQQVVTRLDRAAAEGALVADPEISGAPLVQQLLADVAAATARMDAMSAVEGPQSARHKEAAAARDSVEAALAAAAAGAADSRRAERDRAAARLEQLLANRAALEARVAAAQSAEVELRTRTRDLAVADAIIASLREQRAGMEQRREFARPEGRVLSRARAPSEPSGPNRKLVAVAGSMAGGFLAVLLALTLEALRRGVRDGGEIEAATGLATLCALPRVRRAGRRRAGGPEALLGAQPDAPFSRAVRNCAMLLSPPRTRAAARPGRVIFVTGADAGEGKTTLVAALGRALAADGVAAVAVEADGASDRFAQIFSLTRSPGLRDRPDERAPAERSPAQTLLRADPESALRLIVGEDAPGGAPGGAPGPTERWRSLIVDLRQTFDVTLIDGAGAADSPDSLLIASLSDATVIVARRGRSSAARIRNAAHELGAVSAHVTGVVVNHV